MKNISGGTIDSLRVGFFADWDLNGIDLNQSVAYGDKNVPGVAGYGLVTDPGGTRLVVGLIEPAESFSFFAINNRGEPVLITDDFNKDEKWMTLPMAWEIPVWNLLT